MYGEEWNRMVLNGNGMEDSKRMCVPGDEEMVVDGRREGGLDLSVGRAEGADDVSK